LEPGDQHSQRIVILDFYVLYCDKKIPTNVTLCRALSSYQDVTKTKNFWWQRWDCPKRALPEGIVSKSLPPGQAKKKIIGGRYCNCNCFTQDFLDNCRDKTTGKKSRLHGITYNHSSGYNSIHVS